MMQHIKKGHFTSEVNLSFVFDVLDLFLCFKMTPYLPKLIKSFKFYKWKKIKKSYYFFIIFWIFSSTYKKSHSHIF